MQKHEYFNACVCWGVWKWNVWYDHTNLLRDQLNFYLNNAQPWLSVFVKL